MSVCMCVTPLFKLFIQWYTTYVMTDVSKKHIHKKPHWGQAFEVGHDEVIEPEPVEVIVQESSESMKQPEVVPVQNETPLILPNNDPAYLERLYKEGLALVKLEEGSLKKFFKNLFRKKSHYETVGTIVTQEGRELQVVLNQRAEKFVRYDIYKKSKGIVTGGPTRSIYLPFKKVQPFFRT